MGAELCHPVVRSLPNLGAHKWREHYHQVHLYTCTLERQGERKQSHELPVCSPKPLNSIDWKYPKSVPRKKLRLVFLLTSPALLGNSRLFPSIY